MAAVLDVGLVAALAVIVVFSLVLLVNLKALTSEPEKRRRFLRWAGPIVVIAVAVGLIAVFAQLVEQ